MARRSRIHFDNAFYFVRLEAVAGDLLFRTVADRKAWEALVVDGCHRFGHRLHAFCWLPDRISFAVQVADVPLPRIMQNLSFRYTRYANKVRSRSGALFRGRYEAVVIEPEQYLSELVRYIHNEPVRSGKVKSARDFRWSSMPNYLSGDTSDWLITEQALSSLDHSGKRSSKAFLSAYNRYVESGKAEPERSEFLKGNGSHRVVGSTKFTRKVLNTRVPKKIAVSKAQLANHLCKLEGISEQHLKSNSRVRSLSEVRQLITCVAVDLGVASLTDMATRYKRDLTTMSRNQRYFRDRLAKEPELLKRVEGAKRSIRTLAGQRKRST